MTIQLVSTCDDYMWDKMNIVILYIYIWDHYRMGTRLRYHICSHVHSPYNSTAKGSRMSPLWLKSLQLQVPEKRAFMPKL
jgi:hypothetical protein